MTTTRTDSYSTFPLRGDEPDRDYLAEALSIMDGTSLLLPERAHLDALCTLVNAERLPWSHRQRGAP